MSARSGEVELAMGRRARKPYTELPLWIMFSGISREARLLYVAFKTHVNESRGDSTVWARSDDLAAMMGYSRGDKLVGFRRELESIGAIEVELRGMPARNVYVVHEEPEDDYDGIRDLKQWYAMRREIAPVRRSSPVPRQASAAESTKAQVSPVAPDRGEQGEPAPVAPDPGQQVAPDRGQLDDPNRGGHIELEEKNYPKGTHHGGAVVEPAAAVVERPNDDEFSSEDRKTLNDAVAEVARLRPGWDEPGVVAAIREALAAGHKPERVARHIVECAADPKCRVPRFVMTRLASRSTSSAPAAPVLADVDQAPKRVVGRDDARCPKHRGELAGSCSPCAGEAVGRNDSEAGPTMDGAAARAAIRATNEAARAKRAAEAAEYAALRQRARAAVFGEPVDQADATPAELVEIAPEPASAIPVPAIA